MGVWFGFVESGFFYNSEISLIVEVVMVSSFEQQ